MQQSVGRQLQPCSTGLEVVKRWLDSANDLQVDPKDTEVRAGPRRPPGFLS